MCDHASLEAEDVALFLADSNDLAFFELTPAMVTGSLVTCILPEIRVRHTSLLVPQLPSSPVTALYY